MKDETIRSAVALVEKILGSQDLIEKVKNDPKSELPKIADQIVKDYPRSPPLESDPWIYRIVVAALGSTIILVVLGAIGLAAFHVGPAEVKIPEVLTAIGSASVGALAGLLAPSPAAKK